MTTNWAVSLGGVILTQGCEDDEFECVNPVRVIDGLTDTPDGLGLPSLRTEDVTYAQRDGVKHFSDWYDARLLTFTAVIGPGAPCVDGDCLDVRAEVLELAQPWKRSCCDTELVIYPPCPVPHTEANAYPPIVEEGTIVRTNLATAPRGTRFITGVNELGPNDNIGNGTYSLETTDGPTDDLVEFARKISTSASTAGSEFGLTEDDPNVAPVTALNDYPVTAGSTYTLSFWMRSSEATNFHVSVRYYDNTGAAVAAISTVQVATAVAADTWTRVTRTMTAPVGATHAAFRVSTDAAINGMTTDLTGILFEEAASMGDYFDGSLDDVYEPSLEGWDTYAWTGTADESTSTESYQDATYSGTIESGPYGVVGRPRVFNYRWLNRDDKIAEVLMRFDSVDQRMYILDECGTPGTNSCVEIAPGSQLFSTCFPFCTTGAGFCFSNPVTDDDVSVDPTTVNVGGTEKVFPTITLFGDLVSPTIENLTTGDWIGYDGTISSLPVTINTEEGTAFDSEGTSKTHLLRGSLFMSLDPGNYELRLMSSADDPDPEEVGYATVCWRDTVVVG